MAFNSRKIDPLDFQPNVAVGIDIPLNGNAVFKSNYQSKDAIKNNLINFFLTDPGERFLNPTFGGGLRNFIFEQISNDNIEFLQEDISSKISRYFPNITIDNLEVNRFEDENTIGVKLRYSITNTGNTDEINITFN